MAALVNSQPIDAALLNSQPSVELRAGIIGVLRRWTVLRTSCSNQWGGIHSFGKADHLMSTVHASCLNGYFTDSIDVEDYLCETMEEEFCVLMEDGSEKDLSSIIWEMRCKCEKGDYSLARTMVGYSRVQGGSAVEVNPDASSNIVDDEDNYVDSDDEDDDMDDGGDDEMQQQQQQSMHQPVQQEQAPQIQVDVNETQESMAVFASESLFGASNVQQQQAPAPPARQLGEAEPEKEKPAVDDDGFEAVAPRRSKRKNKGVKGEY